MTVYLLFFLSGVSGLIYQVVWVRSFGNVFGNTVHSASLVSAIFLLGLGLGAYTFGRWADRKRNVRSMLRAYGSLELAIALCCVGLAMGLPRLDTLSALTASEIVGEHGWLYPSIGGQLARYTAAVVLLAPVTFLMGGTLPILIRAQVAGDVHRAGSRSGALYGLNTLGAALGAFGSDFWLIPALGVTTTQLVAAALNVVAGVGALLLAFHESATTKADRVADVEPTPRETAPSNAKQRRVALALLLFGANAMGLEIVWFRHLGTLLGSLRSVFSLLLFVMLLCFGFGALLGGWMSRRFERRVPQVLALTQALVVVTAIAGLTATTIDAGTLGGTGLGRNLRVIFAVVAAPALLMGATYPLGNALAQDAASLVGRRAGVLYFANTTGNVLGSLLVGFVLLPTLGIQLTVTNLSAIAAIGFVPLFQATPLDSKTLAATVAVLAAGFIGLSALPPDFLIRPAVPPDTAERRTIAIREATSEIVAVTDSGVERRLFTNGYSMSSTSRGGQRYMRAFAHIPLLLVDNPKNALVICFGVGNTANAVSRHPVERFDIADVSKNVLEHGRYFERDNQRVLEDPRARIVVDDGRHHLRGQPDGTYALVTLEPPPIFFAGVSALYSREFYQLTKEKLDRGGYLTQWLPIYQVTPDVARSLVKAFIDVFPNSVLLSGKWSELILLGRKDAPVTLDPEVVTRNLRNRPRVKEDLDRIALGTIDQLAGTFAASGAHLRRVTEHVRPLTDDWPILEYTRHSMFGAVELPAELFDVDDAVTWCPSCLDPSAPLTLRELVSAQLLIAGHIYRSPIFLETTGAPDASAELVEVPATPGVLAVIAASRYLEAWVATATLTGPP
ncbi:MAG: MFS transporter [Deltaproteobacteria bacterium]|nr:MFS transporter [Deltaproteobacteria bacterium]